MPWNQTYMHQLEGHLKVRFPKIRSSFSLSEEKMRQLREIVGTSLPDEASFVVFGSLARKEYTSGSDLDWSLVIDGRVDSSHRELELDLKKKLKNSGSSGTQAQQAPLAL